MNRRASSAVFPAAALILLLATQSASAESDVSGWTCEPIVIGERWIGCSSNRHEFFERVTAAPTAAPEPLPDCDFKHHKKFHGYKHDWSLSDFKDDRPTLDKASEASSGHEGHSGAQSASYAGSGRGDGGLAESVSETVGGLLH
jgi:hypothetical protein